MLGPLTERVRERLEPVLDKEAVDLVDLSVKQAQQRVLIRIIVDLPGGGISIGQCSRINKAISRMVEEEEWIRSDYLIEVSSPGLDWPLHTARDFQRVRTRLVEVFFNEPLAEKNSCRGTVKDVVGDQLILEAGGADILIPLKQIKKALQMIEEGKSHG